MVLLAVIMIILLTFAFLRSRAIKKEQAAIDGFWDREEQANSTKKKDISQLDYIVIPLDKLPFSNTEDKNSPLYEYENTVKDLANQKILNLTGYSNTDLKLMYGSANLDELSLADQNFTTLARTLSKWGDYLLQENKSSEAQAVYEYAVECKSDISSIYINLAKIYKAINPQGISQLIEQAKNLKSLLADKLVISLQDIQQADPSNLN